MWATIFFQVCFKHPDLLKQAREACVAKRKEVGSAARARKFDRSVTSSVGPAHPIPAPDVAVGGSRCDEEGAFASTSRANVAGELETHLAPT